MSVPTKSRKTIKDMVAESDRKDVVLNLTLTGARDSILNLLDQMEAVKGFSVLDGSFVVRVESLPGS